MLVRYQLYSNYSLEYTDPINDNNISYKLMYNGINVI